MIIATLELPDNKIIQVDELISGDLVFRINKQKSYWKREELAVFTLPKERRELLSKYIYAT